MLGKTILFKEMILEIRTGKPFDVQFVTLDTIRNTGGERKEYKRVELLSKDNGLVLAKKNIAYGTTSEQIKRDPNHHVYSTINVRRMDKQIRTIHLHLIERFNGRELLR